MPYRILDWGRWLSYDATRKRRLGQSKYPWLMISRALLHDLDYLALSQIERLRFIELRLYADDDGIIEYSDETLCRLFERETMPADFCRRFKVERITPTDCVASGQHPANVRAPSGQHPARGEESRSDQTSLAQANRAPEPVRGLRLRKDPTYPDAFERIWKIYPHGANKHGALPVWRKLAPDEALVRTMESAIAAQDRAGYWRKEPGAKLLQFVNWLKNRRWEDSIAASVPAKATQTTSGVYGSFACSKCNDDGAVKRSGYWVRCACAKGAELTDDQLAEANHELNGHTNSNSSISSIDDVLAQAAHHAN